MSTLDSSTLAEICRYCIRGDLLAEAGSIGPALDSYWAAWDLLPEPRSGWPISASILAAIGDAIFCQGDYEAGRAQFQGAMGCARAEAIPQIHLRLGQCRFELGDLEGAEASLGQALRMEGPHLFRDEHPKYLAFVRRRRREVARPPGSAGTTR